MSLFVSTIDFTGYITMSGTVIAFTLCDCDGTVAGIKLTAQGFNVEKAEKNDKCCRHPNNEGHVALMRELEADTRVFLRNHVSNGSTKTLIMITQMNLSAETRNLFVVSGINGKNSAMDLISVSKKYPSIARPET